MLDDQASCLQKMISVKSNKAVSTDADWFAAWPYFEQTGDRAISSKELQGVYWKICGGSRTTSRNQSESANQETKVDNTECPWNTILRILTIQPLTVLCRYSL